MEPARANIIDYAAAKSTVEVALAAGDLAKVKHELERVMDRDDGTRNASENLFVYRTLGTLYEEIGADEEATRAFVRAYDYDSRDRRVLETLATTVLEQQGVDSASEVLTRLLLHHRYTLRSALVARVYQALATIAKDAGDLDKARANLEKALEARPGDMDIINALLGVAEEAGDDAAVLQVRERLLTTLTNAESRAAVLVAIGDDYLQKLDDAPRAFDAFERALAECATSQPALLRITDLSVRQEDWQRAVRSLTTLGEVAEETEQKVKYLNKAAAIYRDKLGEHPRAIQTLNRVLDLDPNELDAFKAVARMLLDMEDWRALEENYLRMIERQTSAPGPQANVLVVLYRNLGELRTQHLNEPRAAAEAYQAASDLVPDELGFHQILGELYSQFDETLPLAVREQRHILRLAPEQLEAVDALAALYRRLERFDESLCIYRVLQALDRSDEVGTRIVERYSTHRAPKIDIVFDELIWDGCLRSEFLDRRLMRIFRVTQPALHELFAHDLDRYGLREKEARFNLDEPSFFAKIYKSALHTLGFGTVPPVYINPNQTGLKNGYLFPPAFMLGQNLLSGREERELAFACAKSITLFRPEFYLAQFGGSKLLQGLLFTIFKTFRPDLAVDLSKDMVRISRTLEKKLTLDEQKVLKVLVDELLATGEAVNLKLYVEAIEDTANRVGLLFCDDPRTALAMLQEEDATLGTRAVPERFGSLLTWAISEQYTDLRARAALAISAGS